MRIIAAALLVSWLATPASATEAPLCPGAMASALLSQPQARALIARSDGLRASSDLGAGLLLWAEDSTTYISPELGVLLTFRDGSECGVAVPGAQVRGVRLVLSGSRDRPVAVEAGICSKVGEGCLPVRLDLSRSR